MYPNLFQHILRYSSIRQYILTYFVDDLFSKKGYIHIVVYSIKICFAFAAPLMLFALVKVTLVVPSDVSPLYVSMICLHEEYTICICTVPTQGHTILGYL